MKQLLTNVFDDNQTLKQDWPQINLLHPNSINLVCDASTIFTRIDNSAKSAVVASSIVYYDDFIHNFVPHTFKPISIRSSSPSFSELVAVLVGLENLYRSMVKRYNHNVLNVFSDSSTVIKKFRPLFAHVKAMRQNRSSPDDIIRSMDYSTDLEQLIVYNLVLLNMDPNLYHIKAHTNNLNYIDKVFVQTNGIKVNSDELIFLSSVHSMVDSLTIKVAQNIQ